MVNGSDNMRTKSDGEPPVGIIPFNNFVEEPPTWHNKLTGEPPTW